MNEPRNLCGRLGVPIVGLRAELFGLGNIYGSAFIFTGQFDMTLFSKPWGTVTMKALVLLLILNSFISVRFTGTLMFSVICSKMLSLVQSVLTLPINA